MLMFARGVRRARLTSVQGVSRVTFTAHAFWLQSIASLLSAEADE
jgi:hypothetical protein